MAISSDTEMTVHTRELAAIMFSDIAGYTTLMGRDEREAVRALAEHRQLVRSLVPRFNGRMIGDIGDGALASFHSALDAVNCARAVQASLDRSTAQVRIGIHLGDVLFSESGVMGDGVNVASRIHALAPPGGVCISSSVYDEIRNKPEIRAKDLGEKQLKNVSRPIRVYSLAAEDGAVAPSSRRARSWIWRGAIAALVAISALFADSSIRTEVFASVLLLVPRILPHQFNRFYFEQKIGFCTTSDGVRIAYGTSGKGPPVVYVVTWDTDLEHGDGSGTYGSIPHVVLGASQLVVQYDGRGFGASDRGIRDFSLEARLRDLDTVADALKLKRFALWAYSAGGPVAIAYAARHPERVTRLVLQETYANYDFALMTPDDRQRLLSFWTLVATNSSNISVLDLMSSFCWPSGDEVDWRIMTDMLKSSGTPEDIGNFLAPRADNDVTSYARQIRTPTLILHARNDQLVPVELARHMASLIPNSRFVVLEGRDHVPPLDSSEVQQAARAIKPFLDQDRLAAANRSE
ncbi:MAG TPA: alpha/beta fold hydrolase [Candidatus Binataceae bacterium]|nr:alpha/beta fold hydrolase [Candidatus Binataceae bacterium]